LYKGDVGYVQHIENWGRITLLLVPRLPSPPVVGSFGKRKQSGTHANPHLFTEDMVVNFTRSHGISQFQQGEDDSWWTILGCKFQHALKVRTVHRHSVSPTSVSMPSSTFYEFKKAPHPDIMNVAFPCLSEWKFSKDEHVVAIKPSGKRGIIKAMHPHLVEVDLEDGEGIANVPWSNFRKYVAIGDFAEVISGALCGEKGWVVEINGDEFESVRIAEWNERQEIFDLVLRACYGGRFSRWRDLSAE